LVILYYGFSPFSVGKRVSPIAYQHPNAHAWDWRGYKSDGRLRREDGNPLIFCGGEPAGISWGTRNEDRERIRSIDFVDFVAIEPNSKGFVVVVQSVASNCVSIAKEIDRLRSYEGALWGVSWKNGYSVCFWV
jgi:hypothetical protein